MSYNEQKSNFRLFTNPSTLNVQHRIMYSVSLKKLSYLLRRRDYVDRERIYFSKFDSAESFDPVLTTEELVAGCRPLVLTSIKRSVINIRCSMLDVRCSTFNLFTAPDSRISQEVSHKNKRGFKVSLKILSR